MTCILNENVLILRQPSGDHHYASDFQSKKRISDEMCAFLLAQLKDRCEEVVPERGIFLIQANLISLISVNISDIPRANDSNSVWSLLMCGAVTSASADHLNILDWLESAFLFSLEEAGNFVYFRVFTCRKSDSFPFELFVSENWFIYSCSSETKLTINCCLLKLIYSRLKRVMLFI